MALRRYFKREPLARCPKAMPTQTIRCCTVIGKDNKMPGGSQELLFFSTYSFAHTFEMLEKEDVSPLNYDSRYTNHGLHLKFSKKMIVVHAITFKRSHPSCKDPFFKCIYIYL